MENIRPGYEILDQAHSFLGRFAILPSKAARDAVVLWAAHTWAVDALGASPRLAVLGSGPGCGKTRLLELAGMLSHDPCQEIDPTGPGLVSLIKARKPTIFIDETDTIWNTNGGASHRQLRAILNAGYKAGSTTTRRSGGGHVQDPVYCAVGLGGIGILPDALMTRSVVIRMRKRKPEERIERYMPRMHAPTGKAIGEALGSWVKSVTLDIASAWTEFPDGIEDRAAEIWEPLLAIADAAGGDWPGRARDACTELALGNAAEAVKSPGQMLLEDLRVIWGSDGNLGTAEIVRRLFALETSPWAQLWAPASAARELSALLAPYGLGPEKVRPAGGNPVQGYRRTDLEMLWEAQDVLPVPEHSDDLAGVS